MTDDTHLENDVEAHKRDLRTRISLTRTICEVHREIYDALETSFLENRCPDQAIIGLLEEAYVMAKKMDAKLRQYKEGYSLGWYKRESAQSEQQKTELRSKRK